MSTNCLIQTNINIDPNVPFIIVDIFIDGQQGSYKNLIIDYEDLSIADKVSYGNFVDTIIDNDGANVSDCYANLLNTPTFSGYNVSIQIARNGNYTGFNPCSIDYNNLSAAYKGKITSFMAVLKTLFNV